MKLELENVFIRDIQFADVTKVENGILFLFID